MDQTQAKITELRTATVEDVLSWESCSEYPESRVREILSSKEQWTALDFLDLDIPIKDRFWLVLRKEMIDARTLRKFACRCVRETPLGDGRTTWDLLTDDRSRRAVEVAERYAEGQATGTELVAARFAAWFAAESAAESAAGSAAGSAAESAARFAAGSAAESAARFAARFAARYAQLEILRNLLNRQ